MYAAEDNKIFYCSPNETGKKELFLTVHPTDSNITMIEQAKVLADKMNEWSW